jgi:16S rRNA (guanine527-N7)-methyltransferase
MHTTEPLAIGDFQAATNVSRETFARLKIYADLLSKWNRSINLVAGASLVDPWRRHFLDSAQLWPLLPSPPSGRPRVLVDLGSGAGFPGLVLAIMGAGMVHLIDADQRKAVFLREVARATGADVVVHACRIEDVTALSADVVMARACAPLHRLLGLSAPFLRPTRTGQTGGIGLFLKGRSLRKELTDSTGKWKMHFDLHPSRTDPAAQILRLSCLTEGNGHP